MLPELFSRLESQHGLPSGFMLRTAEIESNLNPKAKNPRSSAGGLFQFIDSTAKQYGLNDRYDPLEASQAAAQLASDNASHLRKVLGRSPTGGELYLAHQQGAGGASKLLANPNARAADVVGREAVRLNGGKDGMSAGEFANIWFHKFGSSGAKHAAENTNPANLSMGEEVATDEQSNFQKIMGILTDEESPSNLMGMLAQIEQSGQQTAAPVQLAPRPQYQKVQINPLMAAMQRIQNLRG